MIIGTAGHIDHGKSTLVRALTGVDTDRLKEEKARGISIDLGFAYLPLSGIEGTILGFVDVPGHERFVHTMLAGASGIDFVLLAVAADDGVMPQTREHLAIVELLGIRQGLVALTKADLVDQSRLDQVSAEISAVLAGTGLEGAEIVPISALSGDGVARLRSRLAEAARTMAHRMADGRFRLAVDRSFTLAGAGTVVTGTVLSGRVRVGDKVTISPTGLSARVRSIHAQDRAADEGMAGERCGLNLAGDDITKQAITRGDVVLDPALHHPADHIDASLKVLASEPQPVGQWFPVRLHAGAREVGARIVLLGEPIPPGAEGRVQLVLEEPIAAAVGDRFVVRDTSARRTVGGGVFLDLRGPARKRRTPERLAQLGALALPEPAQALAALLDLVPFHVDFSSFVRDHALSAVQAEAVADQLELVRLSTNEGVFVLSAARFAQFRMALLTALETFHRDNPDLPGLGRERLRLSITPRLPAPAFLAALRHLAPAEVRLEGAWVRRVGFELHLTPEDEALWARTLPLISNGERFRPPRVRDISDLLGMPEGEVRRLMKLTGRMGWVDQVAHDHFFLRSAVGEMVEIVRHLSSTQPKGELSAAQFRDVVQNGRKVAIQILEFFDRHGVTFRRGDLRRVNRHRLDLFAAPAEDAALKPPQRRAESTSPLPESGGEGARDGGEASLVGRPDFKSGRGREPVLGGFDSHSLPPSLHASYRGKRSEMR